MKRPNVLWCLFVANTKNYHTYFKTLFNELLLVFINWSMLFFVPNWIMSWIILDFLPWLLFIRRRPNIIRLINLWKNITWTNFNERVMNVYCYTITINNWIVKQFLMRKYVIQWWQSDWKWLIIDPQFSSIPFVYNECITWTVNVFMYS